MKKTLTHMLFILGVAVFSVSVSASISSDAASASHRFEIAAAATHNHLHHVYGDSYESHGLEEAGEALHSALHDYQHNEATEADVVMKMEALKLKWNDFRQTIIPAGILNMGDTELDDLYQSVKDAYKDVRFLLRKAK